MQWTVFAALYVISFITANYWKIPKNRRKFLIDFAAKKGFDPHVSKNWNKVTKKDIIKKVQKKNKIPHRVLILSYYLGG